MKCIKFMMMALFLLVGLFQGPPAEAQTTTQPNIVFIVLDDFNDWTTFLEGHQQTFTPNMDRLAAQGVNFVNAFTSSPVCAPSRTSFLTGKEPKYTKVTNNKEYREKVGAAKLFRNIFTPSDGNPTVYTIPEWLKDSADYYTIGLGKVFHGWYTGGHDNDYDEITTDPCARGLSWSEFVEFDVTTEPLPVPMNGPYHDGVHGLIAGPLDNSQEDQMIDTRAVNWTCDFIDDYSASPSDYCDKPFFLTLGIYRPHVPLLIPEKYFLPDYNADIYQYPYDIPFNDPPNAWPPNGVIMSPQPAVKYADFNALNPVSKLIALGYGRHMDFENYPYALSPPPIIDSTKSNIEKAAIAAESKRALVTMSYLAAVRYVDAQIGKVLDKIEAHPALAANTVIVLTSDHGLSLGQKKHWLKNSLWDQVIHVPLIILDPRRSGGTLNKESVSLIDLFPTMCDLAQVGEPTFPDGSRYLDGESIIPLFDDPGYHRNKPALTTLKIPEKIEGAGCFHQFSVRTDKFHLIRNRGSDPGLACDDPLIAPYLYDELYNVGRNREIDPYEWYNLADDPDYAAIVHWLAAFLPGKALNQTIQPVAEINAAGLPCSIDRTDTLFVTKSIFGTSNPEDYQSFWHITGIESFFETDTFVLKMTEIPDSVWDSRNELIVYLSLVDSLGQTVAIDIANINSGDDALPDASFTYAFVDSSRVLFTPNEFTNVSENWNFGDGTVLVDNAPAPHLYTRPGDFIVSRTVRYNRFSTQICDVKFMDTVSVVAAQFSGACMPPNPADLFDITPDQAWMKWEGVFGAANYAWRVREEDHEQSSPWMVMGGSAQESVLTGLEEVTPYQFEVKAYCLGGKQSTWSAPATFMTGPCRPPLNLEYELSGDSVLITFEIREEAERGADIFLFKDSMLLSDARIPSGVSQFVFNGLPPEEDLGIYIRSRCDQIGPGYGYRGKEFSIIAFTTLPADTAAARTNLPAYNLELKIRPNPARDFAFVHLEGDYTGFKTIQVIDQTGRIVETFALESGQAWQINTGQLPKGTYFISAEGKTESATLIVND